MSFKHAFLVVCLNMKKSVFISLEKSCPIEASYKKSLTIIPLSGATKQDNLSEFSNISARREKCFTGSSGN